MTPDAFIMTLPVPCLALVNADGSRAWSSTQDGPRLDVPGAVPLLCVVLKNDHLMRTFSRT